MIVFGENGQQPTSHVTFAEGNTLRCGQDFRYFRGAPANVRFAVYPVAGSETQSRLVAPGYGDLGGNYGNGAIYLFDPITPDVATIEPLQVG